MDRRARVRTRAQTHESVACLLPRCLSQFCQQSVSSEKQPLSTNVTTAYGDIKAYWTKGLDCSLCKKTTGEMREDRSGRRKVKTGI